MVAKLLAGTEDGMTVTGVFSPQEAAEAVARLDASPAERTGSPIGWVLGMPIGEVGPDSRDRTNFFDNTEMARAEYLTAFGVDPLERIATAIDPMAGHLHCAVPTEDGREYNAGHVRWFLPGYGGLRAHAGNEFGTALKDGAMNHLFETTQIMNHLSYFLVLQKPEIGGSLSVYDILWSPDDERQDWSNGERNDAYFDVQPRMTIDPEPGDLVMFGGGFRWHRIEPVHGSIPRMTYGGFCAPSVDDTQLHFWI